MFQIFEAFSSWLHFVDKKHWTHLETMPFRGASNINIIISSIVILNRLWIIIRKAKIETIIPDNKVSNCSIVEKIPLK